MEKRLRKKKLELLAIKKAEEECKQAENEMYKLISEKMELDDSIKFADMYAHAALKDYYRDERLKLESNMVERSKEEDVNIKLNFFYAGMYTVMGVLALDTWLKNRK